MKARQRRRPVTDVDIDSISLALAKLRSAREDLRQADAHNAANYVARAIKSTVGALNNAISQQKYGDARRAARD